MHVKGSLRNKAALPVWKDITPLARNEWTYWVISGKKAETSSVRIEWMVESEAAK